MLRLAAALVAAASLLLAVLGASTGSAFSPVIPFSVFSRTDLPLGGVVWTGKQFLYVPETTGELRAGDTSGQGVRTFARVQQGGEEMRCVFLVGSHGFERGLYCHTPDNRILRLSPDGKKIEEFARLPAEANKSDGALTFDTGGKFGYGLVAATGGSSFPGGEVFAIHADRAVAKIGSYSGPGGAENAAIAPSGFGPASGNVLITVDQADKNGWLLAMAPDGTVRKLLSGISLGLNPIAVLNATGGGTAKRGLYLADWQTRNILFAPASRFRSYLGQVLVGTEKGALLYVIGYRGGRYRSTRLSTNLADISSKYNVEGALFLAG